MEMNLTARPEFLSDNIQFLALNHDFPHISSIKRSTDAFFVERLSLNRGQGGFPRIDVPAVT